MILSKIYTRTGDAGMTSLVGGIKASKDSARIEAYGTIDELSSHIGLLCALLDEQQKSGAVSAEQGFSCAQTLSAIQNNLFNVSTYLATDTTTTPVYTSAKLAEGSISELEHCIDDINTSLPALTSFVIPGGSILAAQCHVCRTVCRRAERRIVALVSELGDSNDSDTPVFNPDILRYVNRLSDYLFVLARKLNFLCNTEEKIWQNTCK